MAEVLTSAAMKALETAAIESGRTSGLALMERAGQEVLAALGEAWPGLGGGRAVVLCGPGNNGGDGFVVARLLAAEGWQVRVFFYGTAALLPPDARANHDRWRALAGAAPEELGFPEPTPGQIAALARAAWEPPGADLVVDALFGIGLNRPATGLASLFAAARRRGGEVRHLSIDLPSGLGEDGAPGGDAALVFPADLTVTFHRRKRAHLAGAAFCGRLVVRDIGL